MSLRARERASGHRPAEAETYRRQFVVMVHRVLAAGFAALRSRSSDLAAKEETEITGLLVDEMRLLVESRRCPSGAEHFAIHDDRPESSPGIEGKHRPRIDVFVERTGRGPRPKFHFEAKRLNASHNVATYLGVEGLGRFLSGKYAKHAPDAGMLGYVQDDSPSTWADPEWGAALMRQCRAARVRVFMKQLHVPEHVGGRPRLVTEPRYFPTGLAVRELPAMPEAPNA